MVESDNMSRTGSLPRNETPASAPDSATVPPTDVATVRTPATSEAEDWVEAHATNEAIDKVDVKVSVSASAPRKEARGWATDSAPVGGPC